MNQLTQWASLAREKETYACSSLGFRDEKLLILEKMLEQYDELDFDDPRDISISRII